jgi:hypothetical protein
MVAALDLVPHAKRVPDTFRRNILVRSSLLNAKVFCHSFCTFSINNRHFALCVDCCALALVPCGALALVPLLIVKLLFDSLSLVSPCFGALRCPVVPSEYSWTSVSDSRWILHLQRR